MTTRDTPRDTPDGPGAQGTQGAPDASGGAGRVANAADAGTAGTTATTASTQQTVRVGAGNVQLEGTLTVPPGARGVVLFAHGSGSSRHSPRNRFVAGELQRGGLATLLIDLLTADEEAVDLRTRHLRFDIGLLAERLVGATDWLAQHPQTEALRVGYFGSSTGGGAALVAAAERPEAVGAVVSRGGRPDLAGAALPRVTAPTLLIVGGDDVPVIGMNREALAQMTACAVKRLEIVPGATHLFEEPGKLAEVARLARDWLATYLAGRQQRAA
jgi:dienelactone hydrolase